MSVRFGPWPDSLAPHQLFRPGRSIAIRRSDSGNRRRGLEGRYRLALAASCVQSAHTELRAEHPRCFCSSLNINHRRAFLILLFPSGVILVTSMRPTLNGLARASPCVALTSSSASGSDLHASKTQGRLSIAESRSAKDISVQEQRIEVRTHAESPECPTVTAPESRHSK